VEGQGSPPRSRHGQYVTHVERKATLGLLIFVAPLAAASYYFRNVPGQVACALVVVWLLFCLIRPAYDDSPTKAGRIVVGPMSWTIQDFMRHWLIVGRSGCGKTISAVKRLMIAFYKAQPKGGGLVTDEKGDFAFLVEDVFKAIGLRNKLLVIRVPPPEDHETKPAVAMNLLGDRRISWSTYASFIVDVAVSQGQKTSQAFFKTQARDRIEDAMETIEMAGLPVTLVNVYEFFKLEHCRLWVLEELEARGNEIAASIAAKEKSGAPPDEKEQTRAKRIETLGHLWLEFASKAGEEASGIKSTAENYLRPYAERGLENTFSAYDRTDLVSMDDMDKQRVLVPTIPQSYTGRRYIMAFFKILYYQHALMRYDRFGAKVAEAPPLVLWADEGQNTLLPTEGGLSDITSLDKIRAANCTVVFAMQDYVSAIPAIDGQDKAEVLFTNLNNQLIFSLNSSKGRKIASDHIGESEQWEYSHSTASKSGRSISRSKKLKAIYPPTYFRNLRRFQCVMLHCEGRFLTTVLPPVNDNGRGVPRWYFWTSIRDMLTSW
jgi:hypothetical protein